MIYKTVKLPSDFVEEVKLYADKEYRSISQQLLYWAELGKEIANSYIDEDKILGALAIERYNEERGSAVRVKLSDL